MNSLKRHLGCVSLVVLWCCAMSGCSATARSPASAPSAPTPSMTFNAAPTLAPYPRAAPLASPLTSPLAPASDATPSFIMPTCTPKVEVTPPPRQWPANFPLPRNTQIYRALVLNENAANAQLQITALAPLNLADAARFIFDRLPPANYQVLYHEEEPTESEGLFRGNGWRGSWRINTIPHCEGATTWIIILVKL